jgi:hypothetical protein
MQPLYCFIPRLKILAKPKPNLEKSQCVTRYLCTKGPKVKASARLRRLARPRCRETANNCKEWIVSCPSMFYNATETIIKLSQPKRRVDSANCKLAVEAQGDRNYKTSGRTEALAKPKKKRVNFVDRESLSNDDKSTMVLCTLLSLSLSLSLPLSLSLHSFFSPSQCGVMKTRALHQHRSHEFTLFSPDILWAFFPLSLYRFIAFVSLYQDYIKSL